MIWLGAVLNSHGLDLLEGRLASSAPLLQVDPQVLSILPTLEVWQFLYLCHCCGCACFLLPMCLYLCFHKYSVLWYSCANIKGQTDLLAGFLYLFCWTLVFLWLQGLTFPLESFLSGSCLSSPVWLWIGNSSGDLEVRSLVLTSIRSYTRTLCYF